MNLLLKLNAITAITIAFFLTYSNTHTMIIGSSCLTHHNGHKLVLLYDEHALDSNDPIKIGHVKDMTALIDTLTKNEPPIPFFVEISERQIDNCTQQNNLPLSPGNVPIQLALDNSMHHKNITFIPFDLRKHCDYWMRDMLMQKDQFAQAIKQRHQFPTHFYSITTETFLKHLKDRHDLVIDLIEQLPIAQTTKKQDCAMSKQKYEDCNKIICHLLQLHSVNNKKHPFDLIIRLNSLQANSLFITLSEEQSFSVDMNLLTHILRISQKNPLCVINAGKYHSYNIEKRLLSQCEGFTKDISCSMTLPNLQLDNLSTIQSATNVPDTFMNEKMKQFITLTHTN